MRSPKTVTAAIGIAALAAGAFAFQNCSHSGGGSNSSSGPLDGKYNLTSYQCGNRSVLNYYASLGVTSTTYMVNSGSGLKILTLGTGCQISEALAFSYIDATHFSSTEGAVTCGSTCAGQCAASPAPPNATPTVISYSLAGGVLTLSGTVQVGDLATGSDLYNAGCHIGDPISLTLVRQ